MPPSLAAYTDAVLRAFELALRGDPRGAFGAVFFLCGWACLGSVTYQLSIRRWPTARGRLRRAAVEEVGATEASTAERDYRARVVYDYRIAGVDYVGTRVSAWVVVASHNLRGVLRRQLGDRAAGDEVDVIYHPRRPERSFLVRPGGIGLVVTIAAALLALAMPWFTLGR